MKIMVMNSSGSVGKSTIARELLYPRMEDTMIIEVETVNKSSKDFPGVSVWQFRAGDNFDELYMKIIEHQNIIVDVGASQLGEFWRQIDDFAGVDTLFDLFVVPTAPTDKAMADTYKTIRFLRESGIEDEKIKVIFNQVRRSVEVDFEPLLRADFDFDMDLWIKNSKLFTDLGLIKKTIRDVYHPDLDVYKERILAVKDPKEKVILVKSDVANRMAHKVAADFDDLFERLTGLAPVSSFFPADISVSSQKEDKEDSGVSDDDEEL